MGRSYPTPKPLTKADLAEALEPIKKDIQMLKVQGDKNEVAIQEIRDDIREVKDDVKWLKRSAGSEEESGKESVYNKRGLRTIP